MSIRDKALLLWHIQRVKGLVRAHIGAGTQCLVFVQETICTDPGCEGPATELRIVTIGFQEIRATVHKGVSEIVDADLAGVL
ncbi:MAG: hypothetical protein AAF318_01845 [Pseudomonadota bacterium]